MAELTTTQLDRAAGSLLSLATGDALGAGYEFRTPPTAEPEMIGGGLGHWRPGEWTDDTQMAICIAEETATGSLDPARVGERFLDWFRQGQKDVGIQTRRVLGAVSSGADLPEAAAEHYRHNPNSAAGNGSLMRTAPVALAYLGDDEVIAQAAMNVSGLTHGDPQAGVACVLWCIAIDRAVREGRIDGIREGLDLLEPGSRDRWAAIIEEAETAPPSTFRPNGFVVTALQAAHASIHQTPVPDEVSCLHLQAALNTAVRVGDDTDTVAAIAGALLGARWGASAVPFRWRRMLHGWPGYRARDLVRLGVMSARRGKPDNLGWPVAERLVSGYRERHSGTDLHTALPDDPRVVVGGVGALEQGLDVDAVISLCRMGTEDVPQGIEHHEVWLIDSADPAANPNLDFVLADTAEAIATLREEGKKAFVHFVRAELRTPVVAAAYLSRREAISGEEAFARAKALFPEARTYSHFQVALKRVDQGS